MRFDTQFDTFFHVHEFSIAKPRLIPPLYSSVISGVGMSLSATSQHRQADI